MTELGHPRKGCIDFIIGPVTCVFFAVNAIFVILGIVALSLGGVAMFESDNLAALTKIDSSGTLGDIKISGFVQYISIGLMTVGGVLLLIGFLGCFGVAIGNGCFIYLYCMIFAILVVVQLAGFGYIYLYKDTVVAQLKNKLDDGVKNYQGFAQEKSGDLEKALNLAQKFLHCCGTNGGKDFKDSPWYTSSRRADKQTVPVTCCQLKDVTNEVPSDSMCQTKPIDSDNPYTDKGCLPTLKDYIFTRGISAIIVSIVIMVLQLLAICYATIIERSFADDDLATKLYKA